MASWSGVKKGKDTNTKQMSIHARICHLEPAVELCGVSPCNR